MIGRSSWIIAAIGIVIGFGLAVGMADAAGKQPQFVGAKKCKTCHKKELIGNQYGVWQEGKHAGALQTLKGEKALEVAKQKGITVPPHEAPECLKCHVTAYAEDPSKIAKAPLDHEEGVGCESCHGPGSLYKKKKTMADRAKSVAAGMWEVDKDDDICAACHNQDSPNAPAEGYDFAKLREGVQHPIPADVKGNFIELEKKERAEKRAAGGAAADEEE